VANLVSNALAARIQSHLAATGAVRPPKIDRQRPSLGCGYRSREGRERSTGVPPRVTEWSGLWRIAARRRKNNQHTATGDISDVGVAVKIVSTLFLLM